MAEQSLLNHPVALVDILDRVLGQGVVLSGEVIIGIAGVDLVRVSLRALLASVRAETAGSLHQGRTDTARAGSPDQGRTDTALAGGAATPGGAIR